MEKDRYVDTDIGRVYKYKKYTGSMQYIVRIPASIGGNPKFTFKHGEPVRIKLEKDRLIIEKIER